MLESINWHAHVRVLKWTPDQVDWFRAHEGFEPSALDFDRLKIRPDRITEREHNLVTTAGLTRIASLIIGAGGQAMTSVATRIGVGDGSGTAAVGDTDLSASAGSTHRQFKVLDATYPSVAAGVITLQSTFASGEANFAWNEWCIDIGTPTVTSGTTVNATLVNHRTGAALGTKASGYVWALQPTVTLS